MSLGCIMIIAYLMALLTLNVYGKGQFSLYRQLDCVDLTLRLTLNPPTFLLDCW